MVSTVVRQVPGSQNARFLARTYTVYSERMRSMQKLLSLRTPKFTDAQNTEVHFSQPDAA